jgi:hypothetical protein
VGKKKERGVEFGFDQRLDYSGCGSVLAEICGVIFGLAFQMVD